MTKPLYDWAERPPIGEVPEQMRAWVIRPERFGEPTAAFQQEVVKVPEIGDDDCLVYVMAAGVNYNNVWAGLGIPVDVIKARNKAGETEGFHIGGSDAAGIVYRVGKNVTRVAVGDEVVIHCGTWDVHSESVREGLDPMYDPSFRIWGYETNYGSFAQFTRVQAHQCLPRPRHLTWEQSAAYMLVGATAFRMLRGWDAHAVEAGDVALIWGGAGGLGSMAIQITRAFGGVPVAVVSSPEKFAYCENLGAKGCINRKDFDHWGMLPHWKDTVGYNQWVKGVRKFGKAIWEALGERKNPRIVFEHPGEATIPSSIFVCETGGMVAICAGTTGYNATVDLRYLWMRQKRLQGSHFANDDQARGLNELVLEGKVGPCLSRTFDNLELPAAHQLMYENQHPHGNMAILIGAPERGLGATAAAPGDGVVPPTIGRDARKPSYPQEQARLGVAGPPIETEIDGVYADITPVSEVMHPGIVTCGPTDSLEQVATTMVTHDIHALVVADAAGAPIGVVSQTDLVLARQGRKLSMVASMTAADVMTAGVQTTTTDAPLHQAITLMTSLRIHRLVVTQQDGDVMRAVGVLSMTDVVRRTLGD